jgi:hypothetical protein
MKEILVLLVIASVSMIVTVCIIAAMWKGIKMLMGLISTERTAHCLEDMQPAKDNQMFMEPSQIQPPQTSATNSPLPLPDDSSLGVDQLLIIRIKRLEEASSYKDASEACPGIVQLGSSVVSEVVRLLDHEVQYVREHAAKILGDIGDRQAIDSLRTTYKKDSSWEVRWAAASALGRLGDTDALWIALKDSEEHVWLYAAEQLGKLNDDRFIEPLLAIFKDSQQKRDFRLAALQTLSEMNKPQIATSLIDLLAHGDPFVRGGAADTLGYIKDPSAASALVKLLNDPDAKVRAFAQGALAKIQDHSALDSLSRAFDESWLPIESLPPVVGHNLWESVENEMTILRVVSREDIRKSLARVAEKYVDHWILRMRRGKGTRDTVREFVLSIVADYEKHISVAGVQIWRGETEFIPVERLELIISTPNVSVPLVVLRIEKNLYYCMYFKRTD